MTGIGTSQELLETNEIYREVYESQVKGEVRMMSKEKKNKKKMRRLSKDNLKTAKRLLKYMTETYKMQLLLVFIWFRLSCI